ncbi:MAG: molybdopterin-dependent oxidoreductase [Candidatus Humimicrobiaceae bacterium]
MKKILISSITLFLIIFLLSGCQFYSLDKSEGGAGEELLGLLQQNNTARENQEEEYDIPINDPASAYSVPLVDGLHITGSPIEIDINEFRLEIIGEVENPLSLTFSQIKEMDHIRIYAELECPGFFIDKGYWTGVKVKDLLKLAEVKDSAENVEFISYDGSYIKSVSIDDVFFSDGLLVAYHFDDNEFSEVHGYPLRIVAKGEIGAVWVKWLGKIEVFPLLEN